MNLTKLALKRPVAVIICVMALLIFGLSSVLTTPLELTPDIEMPVSLIMSVYPGAGPEEVEELVTRVVEEAAGTITGVKNITSVSQENMSIVMMEFEYGTNMDRAHTDLKEKLDMYEMMLPDSVDNPTVIEIGMDMMPSITLSAEATGDIDLLNHINDEIVPEFEKITGVASVSVSGGQQDYISVRVDPDKLKQYGLNNSSITQLIAAADFSYPAGSIDRGDQSLILRGGVSYNTLQALESLPITLGNGSMIRLGDVATVQKDGKESDSISRYNGHENITISISKRQTASTTAVTDAVEATMKEINEENTGVALSVVMNNSDSIRGSIKSVASALLLGALLSMLVLFLFLGEWKASVIIGTSIPFSLLVTLILMAAADITINVMSLGGLVIGVGMMVDNSIVVIESSFRYRDERRSFAESALLGAKMVTASIVASTITSVVVFLPVSLLDGMSGQIFRQVGFTIIFSLLASLISALTLVPLLFMHLGPVERTETPIARWMTRLENLCGRIMARCFDHKVLVVILSIAMLAASIASTQVIGFELLPDMDQGTVSISVQTRPGLQMSKLDETLRQLEEMVTEYEDVDRYSLTAGGSNILSTGSGSATLSVYLKKDRTLSTDEMVEELRERTRGFTDCSITVESQSMMSMISGSGVQINLVGSDPDALEAASVQVEELMWQDSNVVAVSSSLTSGSPQAEILVDPVMAASYGLTPVQVMMEVSSAVQGTEVTTLRMDGRDYALYVEYPEGTYAELADLDGLLFTGIDGTQASLSEIAEISFSDSPQSIQRENNQYIVSVTAQLRSGAPARATTDLSERVEQMEMPRGVGIYSGGMVESMNEELMLLFGAMMTAVLLVFMVMAIQFNSMRFSIVVMISVPFALVGSMLVMLLSGVALSMTSLMGLIMLVGIVVNNGILLIDTANRLQEDEGMEATDALVQAGILRLRPILMTTLTTVLSQVPLALGLGTGTELMQSMALVIIGGLIASTILTVLLVPTFYLLFQGKRQRKKVDLVLRDL